MRAQKRRWNTGRNEGKFVMDGAQKFSTKAGLIIAVSIFGGAFLLMVYFMGVMTRNIQDMTAYMGGMYGDMHSMHDHMAVMVGEVSKIPYVVAHMDENMNTMNNEMALIESSISGDLRAMTGSVDTIADSLLFIDAKVGNISIDVNRMSGMMGGVTYDIHRGTQSFTSPMDYMRNMMQ